MLQPISQQLENLMFLRDVVIPHMRKNMEQVDFNHFQGLSPEGMRTRCLGGWYAHLRYGCSWEALQPCDSDYTIPYREFGTEWSWNSPFAAHRDGSKEHELSRREKLVVQAIEEASA